MATSESGPKALSLQEMQEAMGHDTNLAKVKEALTLRQGKTFLEGTKYLHATDQAVRKQLWRVREELSTSNCRLVLQGQQIIVPQELCDKVVDLAYQGHQGIAKTKARPRNKVRFAAMDHLVD